MAISQIPVKFIFHSYSDSSTFGWPGLSRSTPPSNGNFTDSCSSLKAHNWQTKCWQIYPLSNGNFTDCCSDSSYFIPTLRAHYSESSTFGRPVLVRCNPPHQMAISQIPALTAHISFLLWELIIWQTRSWQFYPHPMVISQISVKIPISFLLWVLIIWQTRSWQIYPHLTTIVLIFGRPSGGRSNPPIKWQFHRFLLGQLTTLRAQQLADQILADVTPVKWHISQIPVKFIFHSYSKNSTFGWPAVGRSTPHKILIS